MTKLRNTWLPLLALVALLAAASVSCGPGGDPPPSTDDDIEVRIIVDGPGRVIEGPLPYTCRDDCLWQGDGDVNARFEAIPAPGYVFVAWEGACDAFVNPCIRRFDDGDTITARFALHALRLDLTGDGVGTFRIDDGENVTICDDDCGVAVNVGGLKMAIIPQPSSSRTTVDDAWSGPCDPERVQRNYCLVEVTGLTTVGKTWRHPPIASDEAYGTTRNATLTVAAPGVLLNADDTVGDVLTAAVVTGAGPQHGSLTLAPDGGFSYTPATGYVGTDGFRYRVRDAFGNQDTADVVITVVNRPPVAVDDEHNTPSNTPLIVNAENGVLANDTDPDGDTLTATLIDDVSHGSLTLEPDGSFSYTPDTDYTGTDTFTYVANDGSEDSNTATVTITVGEVNRAPIAVDDVYSTDQNKTLGRNPGQGVLRNDFDPDGDALTAILVGGVEHGSLTLNTNGSFTYTPTTDYTGTDTFTYVANDGIADSNIATVTITITASAD